MLTSRSLWVVLVLAIVSSGCVPNRKITYVQYKQDAERKTAPVDTVLRRHNLNVNEYKIQPLDLLYIKVESLTPEDFDFISKLDPVPQSTTSSTGGGSTFALRYGYLVDTNGELEYPVIGKVKVAGLTVFEAQIMLAKMFEPYLTLPAVRVRLLNFRFTILGEVNVEQQVNLSNTRVTILEAVGMAGGLTDLADRSHVKVVRQIGETTQVYYVNLLDESLINSPSYYIQQNDVIVVPPLRQRPFRKYFGQNLTIVLSSLTTVLLAIALLNK